MSYQEGEARLRRRLSREAIILAKQGRWEEAEAVNRSIIESFPADVDAYNRLGKALLELGKFAQAREAYSQALELSPNNAIAQKNLARLSSLTEPDAAPKGERHKVIPELFVGEMGKAGIVNLFDLAPKEVLAKVSAGNQVHLKVSGQYLIVENGRGEYLGKVEPKHGLRLVKLMEGGNEYIAGIVSAEEDKVKVVIKEMFQHPSQTGQLSFPVKTTKGSRPYVRDNLLRRGVVEEESWEEVEYPEREEEAELLPEGFSIVEEAILPEEELTEK